ncbi:MAG TPA: glycosyltransferase family 4 protein [Tepidisphaeraceae bacterium]|nr:glycosyltransferase family 4 protein [Tepidisphaeraceae bacterium]
MSAVATPTSSAPAAVAASADRTDRAPRKVSRVIIASINRAEGDTGVHTHARMLRTGLADAGVTCDCVGPFDGSRKWLPVFAFRPLVLHRLNKTWSTLWHRRWHMAAVRENLVRRLSRMPADVVLAQCPVSARAALDARDALRGNWPVVLVCHFNHSEASEYRDKGELSDSRRYHAMLDFEAKVLEGVDRVIYVSNWARDNVEAVRGLRTRSSAVVWNGVSENDGTIGATSGPAPLTRAALGLAADAIVLVNVGSIEPRKNQLGLIDLFAAVAARFEKAKLVLVGDGPQRGEVEEKVAERRLKGSVLFLGHRRDVPAILPAADLYVHYSMLENCPLALLEAARAGLPVAAVPAGGVPELQAALDCKLDIDPADVRGTLGRLQPILEDVALRREAGERARKAFEKTFTRESMTQAYLRALTF